MSGAGAGLGAGVVDGIESVAAGVASDAGAGLGAGIVDGVKSVDAGVASDAVAGLEAGIVDGVESVAADVALGCASNPNKFIRFAMVADGLADGVALLNAAPSPDTSTIANKSCAETCAVGNVEAGKLGPGKLLFPVID